MFQMGRMYLVRSPVIGRNQDALEGLFHTDKPILKVDDIASLIWASRMIKTKRVGLCRHPVGGG